VLLTDEFSAGGEFREKPDNLKSFHEEYYWDLFAAYFPTGISS